MPHFIVHCSQSLLNQHSENDILNTVLNAAKETKLFAADNIKVRLVPFDNLIAKEAKEDFIHVFAHIMQGRSIEQKQNLSKLLVSALNSIFPKSPIVSANIYEFEKATYFNKQML